MTQKRGKRVKGIVITTISHQEGARWVCVCKEIGTSTFGKDLEQAHEKLLDLTVEHLKALHEVDELDKFFKKHGIRIVQLDKEPVREVELPVNRARSSRRGIRTTQPPCFATPVSLPQSFFA